MAGYPSSSIMAPASTKIRKALPDECARTIEVKNAGREMRFDGVVPLRGAGERRSQHVTNGSSLSGGSRPPNSQHKAIPIRRNNRPSNRTPNNSLPRLMSSWDLLALAEKPHQADVPRFAANQRSDKPPQAAVPPIVGGRTSSTPSKPPPAPRPGRLPTPELDEAPEGMFCDHSEQTAAFSKRKQYTFLY